MGLIKHDAIIVTAFKSDHAEIAQNKATDIGLTVSPLVSSPMNGYVSFFIAPDGSKEGWSDSDLGDTQRAAWIAWAREAWRDHVFIDWVAVRYGGDMTETGPYITAKQNGEDE